MCHLSLFTQPPPLNNDCWWLRQLMAFGSGVAGLSVLTHTHTPPARNTHALSPLHVTSTVCSFITVVHPHADIPLSKTVLECWCTPNHVLSIVCSSTHKLGAVRPHAGTVVCSLPSHVGVLPFHAQFGSWYFSLPLHGLCMCYR